SVRGDAALEPVARALEAPPAVEAAAGPVLAVGAVVDGARVPRSLSGGARRCDHDRYPRLRGTLTVTDAPADARALAARRAPITRWCAPRAGAIISGWTHPRGRRGAMPWRKLPGSASGSRPSTPAG